MKSGRCQVRYFSVQLANALIQRAADLRGVSNAFYLWPAGAAPLHNELISTFGCCPAQRFRYAGMAMVRKNGDIATVILTDNGMGFLDDCAQARYVEISLGCLQEVLQLDQWRLDHQVLQIRQ